MNEIRVAIFTDKIFLGVNRYRTMPREGDYIQLTDQKYIGWRVENVLHVFVNNAHWDVAITICTTVLMHPTRETYDNTVLKLNQQMAARNRLLREDRERITNPNEKWQLRRTLYERMESGETAKQLAEEMGLKPFVVNRYRNDWARTVQRLRHAETQE